MADYWDPIGQMREKDQAEQESMARKVAFQKSQRQQDMREGRAAGETTFRSGSLGRINEQSSPDIASIIAQRRAQMQGFTPEEQNAQREGANAAVNSTVQGNLRALRGAQGANGIRGGMAAGQQAAVLRNADTARAGVDRDVFLKNIDAKRAGLDKMEASTMDREKFNIGQQNKETFGKQATEFGYAGLGAAERGGVMQQILGEKQGDAMVKAAQASGKK